MSWTLEELKSYISLHVNEVDIIELLGLSSEDIAEAFSDLIENKYSYLLRELELEGEEDGEENKS